MKILTTIFAASLYLTMNSTLKSIGTPPSIPRSPPRNLIYRDGESLTLECRANGVPAVRYEWKKNGVTLRTNVHNIRNSGYGCSITIKSTTSMDEGFYQCSAANKYGTALSNTAHVQRAFLDSNPETPEIFNYSVIQVQEFFLPCHPRRSFPKPTYIWEIANDTEDKNPITYLLTNRTIIAENGDLYFAHVLKLDDLGGKLYRCSTYNPYLNVTVGGNYTRLNVTTRVTQRRPAAYFATKFPTVAVVGRSATLTCFFLGKPVPTISWSGPHYLYPDGRQTMSNFNTSLTIENIYTFDAGRYRCNATSPIGNAFQTIDLPVEAAPTFPSANDAPYDATVIKGDSLTFHCNPMADPAAKFVWLQDGKQLDPGDPPTRFLFSHDNRSLTITNVSRDCVDRESKTDLMVIQCNASNVHGYAFAQGYLNVFDAFCENDFDDERSLMWNRTLPGNESFQPCPGNTTGTCSRRCLLNSNGIAFWDQPNFNGCFDKEFNDLLNLVNDNGKSLLKNQTLILNIASELSSVTDRGDGLSPGNLNASVMLLNKLAVLRNGSSSVSKDPMEIKSIVQATSNVLQSNNSNAWKRLEYVKKTVASDILFSADVYGRSLSALNTTKHSIESVDNMVLEAWSLDKKSLPTELNFPSGPLWGETSGDRISISMASLQSNISSENRGTLRVWGSYYRTINDYLPEQGDFDFINSKVLSFSIGGLKAKEKLKRPVLIPLQHNQEEERMKFRRTCAFWNFEQNEWDSAGCLVTSTNATHTICSCEHLTNFAILMSRNPSDDKVLSILTIIGCIISVIALILTVIVYAVTWKVSKSAQSTVLLNLCVALIISYIIFLAGADKVDSKPGCQAVAILLHYFFLAAFFIMLAEGVELLLYIIFVFHVRRTRETIMLIAAAWVLPLIIVAVSVGSTKLNGYGNGYSCWLSVKGGLIWSFVGPVLCIVTVNFVILIIVLRWMSKKRSFIASNAKKRDEIRATIWNMAVTCPVLGLGWLFGVFSIAFDHTVFQYLFVIANTLQGLLIFIFHALFHNKRMNEKISSMYSHYVGRCRKSSLGASTQMTSANDQPSQSQKSDKEGYVSRAVKYYEEIGNQENVDSTGRPLSLVDIEVSDKRKSKQ